MGSDIDVRRDWTVPVDAPDLKADSARDADQRFLDDVAAELSKARGKFGNIATPHEGYAVTLEELDEFWAEVKRKHADPAAMRAELVQVAAMATRTAVDCQLPEAAA